MKKICFVLIFFFSLTSSQSQSWQHLSLDGNSAGNINSQIYSANRILAGTMGGVYISDNNGVNWSTSNVGLPIGTINCLYKYNARIFAAVQGSGVYVSDNNGNTWSSANIGLTGVSPSSFTSNSIGIYVGTMDAGVFKSIDNGLNWVQVNSGITNIAVTSLTYDGTTLYAGTDGSGVFISNNEGLSWSNATYNLVSWYVVSLHYSMNMVLCSTNSGDLRKLNGNSWDNITGNWAFGTVADCADNGVVLFVGVDGDGVHYTCDNGTSWTEWNTGLVNKNIMSLLILNDTNIYAGCTCGFGIWERPFTEPKLLTTTSKNCQGDASVLASGGIQPYSYLWSTGGTNSNVYNLSPGTYIVTTTDNACYTQIKTDTIVINEPVVASIIGDTSICSSETISLSADGGTFYLWSTGETSKEIVVTPTNNITYWVIASVDNCSDTTEHTIDVFDKALLLPTAFAPNGNGYNDNFKVLGGCVINFTFTVYDSWGNKIFQSYDISEAWDGTNNGKPMDGGVYYYMYTGERYNGSVVKGSGSVTLIR